MTEEDFFHALVIAIISSSALTSFIQFLLQFFFTRHDMKQNIVKRLDSSDEKIDRYKAELCRTHILRFADDLRNGIAHSEEYFRQQMLDIDYYNNYCREHTEFSNGLTIIASQLIKDEFTKIYTKGEISK